MGDRHIEPAWPKMVDFQTSDSAEVAVLFGGPSPEHDVSVITGLKALRCLSKRRSATGIYWSKVGSFWEVRADLEASGFLSGVPVGSRPLSFVLDDPPGFRRKRTFGGRMRLEAIVIAAHGGPGEDGRLQGMLDLAGIPYTGPTAHGAALGIDKLAFAAMANHVSVAATRRILFDPNAVSPPDFPPPFVIKPRFGGSSLGVEVVSDFATAIDLVRSSALYEAGAIAEPFYEGWYDLNIGIRTYPQLELSQIERPERCSQLLTYRDKYVPCEGPDNATRCVPADISDELARRIRDAALRLSSALECRGAARIDFLCNDKEVLVSEINTVPGSFGHYLWCDPKRSLQDILTDMIEEAKTRPTFRPIASGADGSLLRSSKSIAAKLG